MTQTLDLVILSTGLDSLRELRDALAADGRTRLLAGGDDIEQLHEEIKRLRPHVALVTLGAQTDAALRFVERLSTELPQTAVICASRDASPAISS